MEEADEEWYHWSWCPIEPPFTSNQNAMRVLPTKCYEVAYTCSAFTAWSASYNISKGLTR
jgi:hypothetical protein